MISLKQIIWHVWLSGPRSHISLYHCLGYSPLAAFFPNHTIPIRTAQEADDDGYWILCPCVAGFLQPMADTDVLTLQERLHLQHVVRQLHDGSGGVLAILFRDAADAQPVAPAISICSRAS